MSQEFYRIQIKKDFYKFSSAHMTVFPDGSKESIHGHNFQVSLVVEVLSGQIKDMLVFSELKTNLKTLCEAWDEKFLLATKNPYLTNLVTANEITTFDLCKKHYALPTDEIALLPVENITTELLSKEFYDRFYKALSKEQLSKINKICIRIEESPGQGSEFEKVL